VSANSFIDGKRSLRLLFLYNADWSGEVRDYQRGCVPSHRLFGLAEMTKLGHAASICPCPPRFAKYTKNPLRWRLYQAIYATWHRRRFDALIATHEAAALPLLLLKRIGLLRTPVLVIGVALLHPRNLRGVRKLLWRWLLPRAEMIVSYASAQVDWLASEFSLDRNRLAFVPLGVDTEFFSERRAETIAAENGSLSAAYCISVGTNEGKDFATLLAALPESIRLTIVTDDHNAGLIERSTDYACRRDRIEMLQNVPIERLRTLYRDAAVHIIPLLESRFSSGQTVLLENMAMGKTVIVSDTSAVRDYLGLSETAIVVQPGDVTQMREHIAGAIGDPIRCRAVGTRAAAEVREKYSALATAGKIEVLLQAIVNSR